MPGKKRKWKCPNCPFQGQRGYVMAHIQVDGQTIDHKTYDSNVLQITNDGVYWQMETLEGKESRVSFMVSDFSSF